jgi:hypothetical protein
MQKNQSDAPADDEMRPEYDLRGGVRGRYYERYTQGTNIVLLEPDVAKVFRVRPHNGPAAVTGAERCPALFEDANNQWSAVRSMAHARGLA